MTNIRMVGQHDILDMVACADSYGHYNSICMQGLYDWAKPVSDEDIDSYVTRLVAQDGFEQEDGEDARECLENGETNGRRDE